MSENGSIPLSEIAPSTDEEWAEALKCYARDREIPDESSGNSSSSPFSPLSIFNSSQQHWSVSQAPPTASVECATSKPPLVHHGDSDDSMDAGIGGIPYLKPENIPGPFKHIQTATEAVPNIQEYDDNEDMYNSEDKEQFQSSSDEIETIPVAFDTARTFPEARNECDFENDDNRSAQNERARLRDFYNRKGWLSGSIPSKTTRLKRRRAIRRLGLVGEEEDGRKAVLSKYAEMAELIFDVPQSVVSLIHDEKEYAYYSDPTKRPLARPTAQTCCSHVVDIQDGECWVVADCSRDWRTKNNPIFQHNDYKFLAAAPLRYHGKDGSLIDFGTLTIHDTKPRTSFIQREKSLMLKLSNMLVYQIATLQSEYMGKRSSAMYEASISFFQRSLLPEPSDIQDRRESSGQSSSSSSSSTHPPPPVQSSREKMQPLETIDKPYLASKAGPRDVRDVRRRTFISDQRIFNDAAQTLKVLLGADDVVVVNLEDYHLFIKTSDSDDKLDGKKGKDRIKVKEKIIRDYLKGEPWPSGIEPVINYTGRPSSGAEVLGTSTNVSTQFHFDQIGVDSVLVQFLKTYLASRQFWWDREEDDDSLSKRIMDLMPSQAQTALGTPFMGHDGKIKFVMFATWNKPPSTLVDSSMLSLPFVWILGGCLMAALAMRKIRAVEQSQISYSNLQAHELRTPLHQILAITQLLRSSMTDLAEDPQFNKSLSLKPSEQVRDLLPFLDTIDTSGRTLHGIVDNILSFLDLKNKEASQSLGDTGLMTTPSGAQTSIEIMFEEIIQEAIEENRKSRRGNGQPECHIETIFEIVPPLLGEQVSEDNGGALRRALSKILANSYKFIDNYGCIEIFVDDVVDLLPPEGCEDIALTKAVSITIKDDGRGMNQAFVNDQLGEPWAKEDRYATGSGLSVHLAYKIIDLMGGCMEIASAPGAGTTVQIDVPLPVRSIPFPESPSESGLRKQSSTDIHQLSAQGDSFQIDRKVCITGFTGVAPRIEMISTALKRQYAKLGCDIVPNLEDAELIIAYGGIEENIEQAKELFHKSKMKDIVFLIADDHSADQSVLNLEKEQNIQVRRFKRPTNPSILRETLFPNHSQVSKEAHREEHDGDAEVDAGSINTPHLMSPEGNDLGEPSDNNHKRGTATGSSKDSPNLTADNWSTSEYSNGKQTDATSGMNLYSSIASLSLGEYFPALLSPKKHQKQNNDEGRSADQNFSNTSPNRENHAEENDENEHNITPMGEIRKQSLTSTTSGEFRDTDIDKQSCADPIPFSNAASGIDLPSSTKSEITTPESGSNTRSDESTGTEKQQNQKVKVLVVEDNKINRTILVKILQTKSAVEVFEAEDGDVAVEVFESLSGPIIVLLDINMPRKDGYQACTEMRLLEKNSSSPRQRAEIIAVTALVSDEAKKRGLVECEMDEWHTKPCSKSAIIHIVDKASQRLLDRN